MILSAALLACTHVEEAARLVMSRRQVGEPMVNMYEAAEQADTQRLVREAYARKRYATEARQKQAVQDFGDEMYAKCLEERNGRGD